MPGPVSDSYDPEFGTGANAARVRDAVGNERDRIAFLIGDPELKPILEIVGWPPDGHERASAPRALYLNERSLRILRFALNRALETL